MFEPKSGKTSAKMAKGHLSKGVKPTKFVRMYVKPTKPTFRGKLKKGQRLA